VLGEANLESARQFIWRNARVIDRRRFEFLFEGGPAQPVVDALRAYRNADGGFGHGLEPDILGPESQPIQVYAALLLLDEIGRLDEPMLAGALSYLESVAAPGGGVPALVPAGHEVPHAPWMTPPRGPSAGSLLPTAGIAGLLLKHGVSHPWLDAAGRFCWDAIGALETSHPYEVEFALTFLDHATERARAQRGAERLAGLVRDQRLVLVDRSRVTDAQPPAGYAPGEFHYPLNYAREPTSLARAWFSNAEIEANLDALEQEQCADGCWMFNWGRWNEATTIVTRGVYTIHVLRTLRSYGRME
jgi:hypothetical protein